jgi:hypothetical protein
VIAAACAAAPLLAGCAGRDHGVGASSGGGDEATAPPTHGAASLRGVTLAQLTERLGAADFRRSDGPTELLQYRSSACVLDVFVYHEVSGDTGRVEHIEARDHGLAPMPEDACLQTLARPRPARGSG